MAAIICLASAFTAFAGYRRALRGVGGFQWGWSGFTGLVGGAGVWATHFIAMLAYQPGLIVRYEPLSTGLSLVLAVVTLAIGFQIAVVRQTPFGRVVGGVAAGLGVGLMHFTGMAAVRTQAELLWRPEYVISSLVLGMAGAAVALWAAGGLAKRRQAILGPLLLVVAICSLHFTAMAAVTLLPNPGAILPDGFIDRPILAVMVAALAGLIIIAAACLLWMERLSSAATLSSLKDALDRAPSALAFFNSSERLTFWNEGYGRILHALGMTPEPGLKFAQIVDQAAQAGVSWTQSDTAERQIYDLHMPDGRRLRGEIGATRDGGTVAVYSDITDQIETAERLAEAKEKAEAASRAKSEFLTMMSHELRTPLNGILGMAQAMKADRPSAKQRERLSVIQRSGVTLLGVLNDILDLSKIEAGELAIKDDPFDMEHALRGAVAVFAAQAEKKGLVLDFTLEDAARGMFRGDAVRLQQMLNNLLSNAVKFTEAGRIEVAAAYGGDGLVLTVADTGVGISAEQMPVLFDKFVQGDASLTRRFGGAGLGLSICAQLAELMGGAIHAVSEPGAGAVFTVRLPLVRIGEVSGTQARADAEVDVRGGIKVLVAEDNEVNQLVLRTLLAQAGVEPVVVGDGALALEAWRREAWDLILMDIQMPNMDGASATRAIRTEESAAGRARTPIIAVTANAMVHQLRDYAAAGMDDVVTKPVDVERLYAAMDQALAPPEPEPLRAAG